MRQLLFLVDISIHLEASARHVYVEVVMHGKTEGSFLEDSEAHNWETLGEVSRLGAFDDVWPNEKLMVPLVEISSLLDTHRHRPWGGGHHLDIADSLLEGGLSGGGCYILPTSRFSEERSG